MTKVIVLHGTGRSGTTVLNNILVNHPDLAWLSNYQVYALRFPILSFLNRFVSHSVDLNSTTRGRFRVHSSNEPYAMWRKFYPNFQDDVDEPTGTPFRVQKYVDKIAMFAGKKRFVTKITGLSRANFLAHAFEDYQVVWIDRDPRAVVCSMMKQRWFFRKKATEFDAMDNFEKISFYCNYYKNVLATKAEIPSNKLINVRYEDLVANPVGFFKELTQKLSLSQSESFNRTIKNWQIDPIDGAYYQKQFSAAEWDFMNKLLGIHQ